LLWQRFMKPRIIFGVSLEELSGLEKSVSKVKALLKMYTKEKYILTLNKLNKDTEFSVSFKVKPILHDLSASHSPPKGLNLKPSTILHLLTPS
jgi:hypothetical protein